MSDKKGTFRYAPIVQRLQEMDEKIVDLKNKIDNIKQSFCSSGPTENLDLEEECADEIESEIAVLEIMKNVYLECLTDEESEGDA